MTQLHELDVRIAVTMAAGAGTYLLGESILRLTLGLGRAAPLLGGAAVAVATAPVGVSAAAPA